jgi:hypothetical protein
MVNGETSEKFQVLCKNPDEVTHSPCSLNIFYILSYFCHFLLCSLLRIRDVYLGSEFFHPESRAKKAPVPDADPQTKNLSVFNPKNGYRY